MIYKVIKATLHQKIQHILACNNLKKKIPICLREGERALYIVLYNKSVNDNNHFI